MNLTTKKLKGDIGMQLKKMRFKTSIATIIFGISLAGCATNPVDNLTVEGGILQDNKITALPGYALKKVKSTNYNAIKSNCSSGKEVVVLYRMDDFSISSSNSCGCFVVDDIFTQDLGGGCVLKSGVDGSFSCMETVCNSCGMTSLIPIDDLFLAPVDR